MLYSSTPNRTLRGDCTYSASSGSSATTTPATNAAPFTTRRPARFTTSIHSSSTGASGAVSNDAPAAAPLASPAAAIDRRDRQAKRRHAQQQAYSIRLADRAEVDHLDIQAQQHRPNQRRGQPPARHGQAFEQIVGREQHRTAHAHGGDGMRRAPRLAK